MKPQMDECDDRVGPVLSADVDGRAVLAAIRGLNPGVEVVDRGSYWRVLARHRCVVTRQAIEQALGGPFRLPGDLERVMPSFKGRFSVDRDQAAWSFGEP